MSETTPNGEVTVIFRKGNSLIVPPVSLPRETRLEGETYETTMRRLVGDHGFTADIEHSLLVPENDTNLKYAYLLQPYDGELDLSPFFIEKEQLADHLRTYSGLSELEKQLIMRAGNAMPRRPL